jgi:hypothetical protein
MIISTSSCLFGFRELALLQRSKLALLTSLFQAGAD